MAVKNSYKVSVIVPVYGVERFVERCVRSLMEQSLEDAEFIFVDDCTPDRSMEIVRETVREYPGREVKILRHTTNKGLPAARNTGLKAAAGEYVYHCDSDDYVEPSMLEEMYRKAAATGADMVWSDWYLSFEGNERCMSQPEAHTGRDALSLMLDGSMKYNVWNKLTRRTLYSENNISFPGGKAMGEDMTMLRLAACARITAYIPKAFYHYVRVNSGAMTQIYSDRHLSELKENVRETEEFLLTHLKDDHIRRELDYFKLNVKLPFLFTGSRADCRRWRQWYPDADRFIMANKRQALRTRLLQWCASKGMTWVNILYKRLVFDFVYGKVFK